ncbi:MAG: 2-oxo-hepta-3-ene-1,7-dioic acid hydratase, partial [Bradyrhizobium sp.]|nr:2-oxo-hepta-3-ene-1,7-dioic acid hydratase [Bradyrhizobium sp.]
MPLTHDQIHSCALRLDQAEKSRSQIRQLSREFPAITIADAYEIQRAWIDIKVTAGRIIKGH